MEGDEIQQAGHQDQHHPARHSRYCHPGLEALVHIPVHRGPVGYALQSIGQAILPNRSLEGRLPLAIRITINQPWKHLKVFD